MQETSWKKISAILIFLTLFLSTAHADEYQFNTCGAEGRFGPDTGDCGYPGENEIDISGDGKQEWDVPQTGIYEITAYGAAGLNQNPDEAGEGAIIQGEFFLENQDQLSLIVAQQSSYSGSRDWFGGSGGTYIVKDDPLVVAGGGGGHRTDSYVSEMRANTGTTGKDGMTGFGGSNGGGGLNDDMTQWNGRYQAGGGAGWSTQGDPSPDERYDDTINSETFSQGGVGGYHLGGDSEINDGGFGSGGAAGWGDAGGGGGYSGGGPNADGYTSGWGGGGGSFIHFDAEDAATSDGSFSTTGNEPHDTYQGSINNLNEWNTGGGYIEIELLTNPDNPIIQTPFNPSKTGATGFFDPAEMNFAVNIDIDDDGGNAPDNTLDTCDITITGQDNGGVETFSGSITDNGGGGGTGTCEFDIENNDNSNWIPGETVNVEIYVEDSYDGEHTVSRDHSFENTEPETVDISVSSSDSYQQGVWGGSGGVTLEVEATDYESATTNTDLDVQVSGDQGPFENTQIGNGDGAVTVDWERSNQDDMLGFDRGQTYGASTLVQDAGGELDSDGGPIVDVLDEASVSSPSPVEENSGDQLEITVDDNPAIDADNSLNDFDVEFRIKDGPTFEYQGSDTIIGSSGTASIDIENLDLNNPPAEWKFLIDDTYSLTDYGRDIFSDNTDPEAAYDFVTAEPPELLTGDPDSHPIDREATKVDPDLEIMIDDPDNSEVEVRFYEGAPGTNQIGSTILQDGTGQATLPSNEHSLGEQTGTEYEWSVEAEDMDFDSVDTKQSSTWSFTTVHQPQIENALQGITTGDTLDTVERTFTAEVSQQDDEVDIDMVEFIIQSDGGHFETVEIEDVETQGETVEVQTEQISMNPEDSYTVTVEAKLTDENRYGDRIQDTEEVEFETPDYPEVQDASPVGDDQGAYPEIEATIQHGDNEDIQTEIVGIDEDTGNEFDITSETVQSGETIQVSSSELEQTVNDENVDFASEPDTGYEWRAKMETATSEVENQEEYIFSTNEVTDADIELLQGDQQNLNTGNADIGEKTLEVRPENNPGVPMDELRFYIDNNHVETIDSVQSGEEVEYDITEHLNTGDTGQTFDWTVEVEDSGVDLDQQQSTFTTNTIQLEWGMDGDTYSNFKVYHAPQQQGNYRDLGTIETGQNLETLVTNTELGWTSENCYRLTAINIAGESQHREQCANTNQLVGGP